MKVIILAGGGGTRLFPLSRSNYPKQFINIESKMSMLANTLTRFKNIVPPKDILILTNQKYIHYVKEEVIKSDAEEANIIAEPIAKNTLPAIGLGIKYCIDVLGVGEDEVILVAPSDHVIHPISQFTAVIPDLQKAVSEGYIVTFGIRPDQPLTGYGYIKINAASGGIQPVERFIEKPDPDTAKVLLNEGTYYWNSGMYGFSIATFINELQILQPQFHSYIRDNSLKEMLDVFEKFESISIDYAIAEKSKQLAMIPLDLYWSDMGSWDALYDFMEKDQNGNVTLGDCKSVNCKNSLFMSSKRLVSGVGVEDLIIVESDDVIMVTKRGESQNVKDLFMHIADRNEAHEHTIVHKPWGTSMVISKGTDFKVKKITVKPGKSQSLQLHKYRSEHWVVTEGQATVFINGDKKVIQKNESLYVPKQTKHQLMNTGSVHLEMIEVQNGEYLDDDDIIRFNEVYGI